MSLAPSRWVVIDDVDSSINYTGPWFEAAASSLDSLGNFGPTYLDTSHGTKGAASFSFRFQGSAANVFGTTNITNSSVIMDPSWECFIDGVSIGVTIPVQYPENNWLLCTWNNNGMSGSHVITVNATSTDHSFWFDWLKYKPPPTALLRNAVVYLDRQDAAIKYDPSWQTLGVTANMTSTKGSTVTLDFIGTQLTWYGFIPTELPHNPSLATYAIDGQAIPTTFTLKGLATADLVTTYHQPFFQTPVLSSSGPHELVVTFHGDASSTPLTISYILIQNGSLSVFAPYNSSSIFLPPSSPSRNVSPSVIVFVVFASVSILWVVYTFRDCIRKSPLGRLILNPDGKGPIDFTQTHPSMLQTDGPSQRNGRFGTLTSQFGFQVAALLGWSYDRVWRFLFPRS